MTTYIYQLCTDFTPAADDIKQTSTVGTIRHFALNFLRFGLTVIIIVSHRAGYPKTKESKVDDTQKKNDDKYNTLLWHYEEMISLNDENATLRGYFLEDEPGCYICHCLVHPVLVLRRICIMLSQIKMNYDIKI